MDKTLTKTLLLYYKKILKKSISVKLNFVTFLKKIVPSALLLQNFSEIQQSFPPKNLRNRGHSTTNREIHHKKTLYINFHFNYKAFVLLGKIKALSNAQPQISEFVNEHFLSKNTNPIVFQRKIQTRRKSSQQLPKFIFYIRADENSPYFIRFSRKPLVRWRSGLKSQGYNRLFFRKKRSDYIRFRRLSKLFKS